MKRGVSGRLAAHAAGPIQLPAVTKTQLPGLLGYLVCQAGRLFRKAVALDRLREPTIWPARSSDPSGNRAHGTSGPNRSWVPSNSPAHALRKLSSTAVHLTVCPYGPSRLTSSPAHYVFSRHQQPMRVFSEISYSQHRNNSATSASSSPRTTPPNHVIL